MRGPDGKPMNVLLIIADDMRPEMGCYGVPVVQTPHIDSLAASGLRFDRAYCNIPVSGASRASLLTGAYPLFPQRFTHFSAKASVDYPQAVPLSAWFTRHGWHTISNGKVFHHIEDHADSWSEPPYRRHPNGYDEYWAEYNRWELWMNPASAQYIHPKSRRGPFCEMAEVEDTAYDDGILAQKTVADLARLKDQGKPFFLACGFWKPHLPFNAPKKYWDLYDRDSIPVAPNRFRPENLPSQVTNSGEIKAYARVTGPKDEAFVKELKHGYYACMSYIDAQIGKVLKALDSLGLAQNTLVVLLGDHGWHLGEHNFIGKHNLMDHSTRVPLIVRVPGLPTGATQAVVELVDLYPTLCALCGLPLPENQLDGSSFAKVLRKPESSGKAHAYVQWQGAANATGGRYSYARWPAPADGGPRPHFLFDREEDPQENENRASLSSYDPVVEELSQFLETKHRQ